MAITYLNRRQKLYYLHQGKTKLGNPKYFFSMKSDGNLAEVIPDGFEIYETPNAQVFLRKIPKKIITDDEVAVVERGMEKFSKLEHFQIDVKKEKISIFSPNENVSGLLEIYASTAYLHGKDPYEMQQLLAQSLTYSDNLRFVLVDNQKRLFQTERYCYLGSIDDWIEVGNIGPLEKLVRTYVKHIGQESFYELM
ncbi:hypothetical protein [Lyngbya confervoides]|uniref:Uncharacterized protein n=1 Tax=Lyngbya confervoides BDU141951 TaxID=1574623 RepID=A0ABD4T156_9CYAN|nr:hypothetical protein [Lyngbya confervoides]MCM1982032.1 hypothetical protein [Lyngbya confervoides BDU141951]